MNSDYAKFISSVAENLSLHCSETLAAYDLDGEPGTHRIAYSIVEIVESAEKLIMLATKLRQSGETAEEDLSEFRDEIAHLLYHVRDSGLFSDLLAIEQDGSAQ